MHPVWLLNHVIGHNIQQPIPEAFLLMEINKMGIPFSPGINNYIQL